MTRRKISNTLNRIKNCRENGYTLEALLISYHLNIDLVKYILKTCSPGYVAGDKKIKSILNDFIGEIAVNQQLKSTLNKRNLKTIKPWLRKMDVFFKTLKLKSPSNTKALLADAEKIISILNISVMKLHSQQQQ